MCPRCLDQASPIDGRPITQVEVDGTLLDNMQVLLSPRKFPNWQLFLCSFLAMLNTKKLCKTIKHFQLTLSDWRSLIKTRKKQRWSHWLLLNFFAHKKFLFGGDDTLDCKFSPWPFVMCLLEIAEPVCERIFEQTKLRIVIALAPE